MTILSKDVENKKTTNKLKAKHTIYGDDHMQRCVCFSWKVTSLKCRSSIFDDLHFDEVVFRRYKYRQSIVSAMLVSRLRISAILALGNLFSGYVRSDN